MSEYSERHGDVVLGDGPSGPGEIYRTNEKGQLTATEHYGAGGLVWANRFEYEGERLVRIRLKSRSMEREDVAEVLYDCSKI